MCRICAGGREESCEGEVREVVGYAWYGLICESLTALAGTLDVSAG